MSSGWWNAETSADLKLALAAVTLAVVVWNLATHRRVDRAPAGEPRPFHPRAGKLLRALGLLGLCAYFNFGSFHFDGIYVHVWDGLHHYLGAKYIDEIGYDGLYDCIAVADAEDPREAPRAPQRVLTDLRTNRTITAADVIAHPERCRARFTPERWQAFAADVAYFRGRFPDADWQNLTGDHGFNASPVWLLAARPLAGSAPVTGTRLGVLATIDPLLMLAAFAALAWAFGWERAALAAVVWGTYFPGRLWWTGGSFLRWDWLAALLGGLALCRRGRTFAGGALLGYAALSRVLPAFALAGAALALIVSAVRRKPFDRATVRVLVGASVVAALLVPISAAVRRGPIWSDFVRNLAKHTSVPSPNRMGLAAVIAFDRGATHRAIQRRAADVRTTWEPAQARSMHDRRALWIAAALVGIATIAFAVRDQPAWAACVLGLLLIPLGRPLACYYYAFVAALPLLSERRADVGAITVALALASGVVAGMTAFGVDEQYAAQSLLVVLAFSFIASAFVARLRSAPSSPGATTRPAASPDRTTAVDGAAGSARAATAADRTSAVEASETAAPAPAPAADGTLPIAADETAAPTPTAATAPADGSATVNRADATDTAAAADGTTTINTADAAAPADGTTAVDGAAGAARAAAPADGTSAVDGAVAPARAAAPVRTRDGSGAVGGLGAAASAGVPSRAAAAPASTPVAVPRV